MARFCMSSALWVVTCLTLVPGLLGRRDDISLQVTSSGDISASEAGHALLQARGPRNAGLVDTVEEALTELTANSTDGKWEVCATSSMGLIPNVVMIGIGFGNIKRKCDEGSEACKKAVDSIISSIIALVTEITKPGGVVATCQGGDNACADKIGAADGPIASLHTLQQQISEKVITCDGKPGMEMYDCIGIAGLLTSATKFVQSLVSAIHECKRGCKPVEVLGGCNGWCSHDGNNHPCKDRVKYLYGVQGFTLKSAIDKVNYECCHACVCSQADVTDLDDCDKPCNAAGGMHPCANRVKWLFDGNEDPKFTSQKQLSIDEVNGQCANQCSCSIDSPSISGL